jgi:hypothetical protein
MAVTKAQLLAQQERLQQLGNQIPGQAEVFHRDRLTLLGEVTSALSWRGILSRGGNAGERSIRIEALIRLGEGLSRLFERAGQVQARLDTIDASLERIKEPRLAAPDCVPAAAARARTALARLGRDIKIDDDLLGDMRRCDALQAETHALAEAVAQWASAEEVVDLIRSQTRTGPLAAALPDLRERLCREGPTPEWLAALRDLLGPLEQLARREQPAEIRQTDRIIRFLPRWVEVLGDEISESDQDAAREIEFRFKAKRKDWAGEDDRVFQELFEQAAALQQVMLERAADLRSRRIEDLEARYELFAALAGPDEPLAKTLKDLRFETPDNPRDHEDWCDVFNETADQLEARVKGAENDLLGKLRLHLGDCRKRLDALEQIARLDEKDAQLRQAKDQYDALRPAAEGTDTRGLLDKVIHAQKLADELRDLEQAMQADYAGLQVQRDRLLRRAEWLREQARAMGFRLPATAPDPERLAEPGNRRTSLQQERQDIEEREQLLGEAEATFAETCTREIEQTSQRIGQITAVIAPERIRAAKPDLSVLPPLGDNDLAGLVGHVDQVRTRLAAVECLLAEEEQARLLRIKTLAEALTAVSPEQLGFTERRDRELMLRQLERWSPGRNTDPVIGNTERSDLIANADPVIRINELSDLIAHAEAISSQFEAAARALQDRREELQERLHRFNSLWLHAYCPEELYRRVEGLVHPPAHTRWPKDAESRQLTEAGELLQRLERQSERLAAREIAAHLALLDQHAERTKDGNARALVDEIAGLPPEQPPPAHLRRRLAELTLPLRGWR